MSGASSTVVPFPQAEIAGQRPRSPVEVMIVSDGEEGSPSFGPMGTDADGNTVFEVTPGNPPAPQRGISSDRFDHNLAQDLDENAMAALASELLDGIEADLQSRKEWEDTVNYSAKYLGVKLDDPTTSVSADGTIVKAVATTMLEAAVKLWSTARAELLPVSGPVKVRTDNSPPPQPDELAAIQEDLTGEDQGIAGGMGAGGILGGGAPKKTPRLEDLADALEKDMNHYLTVGDREYYPDYSKMLFHRAVVGNAFRKVYNDPLKRKPVSVWVRAQDLIVSNDCSHLSGAGRVTERIRYRQATMRRLMVRGFYRDIDLVMPTGQSTDTETAIAETEGIIASPQRPADFEHLVYECYCEISSDTADIGDLSILDRDESGKKPGYPLPYRVSIDVDSRSVLEVRRNWKQGDEDHNPRRRYVKYGFVPGFGFYDFGLIHLLGNPTLVATMLMRSCVDNALLSNFPAFLGLKGPTTRQENTVLRPGPGEIHRMDGNGAQRIQDVIMPMPYKPPSAEAMGLGQAVDVAAKRLAGVIEIPVGEGRIGSTPVGTVMAFIEAISQVPGAVHKDDHISQQDEFALLRELLAEDPEILWRGNRNPARKWQVAEELMAPDIVPAADPNTPSQIHRLIKLWGLIDLSSQPQFAGIANPRAIYRAATRVLAGEHSDEFELPQQSPPPPQMDPKLQVAQVKAQADRDKASLQAQTAHEAAQAKVAEAAQKADQHVADRQSEETKAAMSWDASRMRTEGKMADSHADRVHDALNQAADRASKTAAAAAEPQQPFANGGGTAEKSD